MKKVKRVVYVMAVMILGFLIGKISENIRQEKRLDDQENVNKKMYCFYRLLLEWLTLKRDGESLAEYFKYNGYKTIAVYGLRELGEQFVSELKGTDIEVKYVIDKNADAIISDLPKYKPDDELPPVDAVVVTAIYYYQDIQEVMEKKLDCPIISLEDVVYGLT